jgi:endonuclease-8
MPEGDTIHKVASYLRPRLTECELQVPEQKAGPHVATLAGDYVESVEAIGKHLVITTDARVLRVHLGMRGTWHHYRHGERWKLSTQKAKVILTAECGVFVCFYAPQVAVIHRSAQSGAAATMHLGPDLLANNVPFDKIVLRARGRSHQSPLVIDMLLDQEIACGIGNAYKSEVLFLEKIAPTHSVEVLTDQQIEQLYRRARALMLPNLSGGPRTTTTDKLPRPRSEKSPRYWVYGRKNQSCLKCENAVQRAINGRHSRVTYWCAHCQSGPPTN